jgi:hypothetical protein
MKARTLLLLLAAALVGPALADNAPSLLSADEQARRFEQNLPLVQSLVEGSLRLADTDDSIQRAQDCELLAEKVASALADALEKPDFGRIQELSEHLHAVLGQGLIPNLQTARKQTPAGTTPARELQALASRLEQAILPLEQRLEKQNSALDPQMGRQTLRLLREERSEIEKASTIPGGPLP